MLDNKDYTQLTIDELLIEEKKVKKKETISSVITGVLIGISIYGVANNAIGFIFIFIQLILLYGNYKNAQKIKHSLQQIQTAIKSKRTK